MRKNFVCSGTHKTIFSGEKSKRRFILILQHHILIKSFFTTMGAKEGYTANGLFHSLSMERNSTRLHAGCSGTYGWKLAEDEEIEGDLVLLGDTL